MQACTRSWVADGGPVIEWEWRSLAAFGDQPVEDVAARFDLLVIDHPFCGTAAATGALAPLDELLAASVLDGLAADAIGGSHQSYAYAGHQWALAVDAACQVTAVRDDLLDGAPTASWDDILSLARSGSGRVALPLAPAHAISSWLTLLANAGCPFAPGSSAREREIGIGAIELLAELASLGPAEALQWEPPDVLARLTLTDELACVPLTYGYVTYARTGSAGRPCRFTDIPSAGLGPVGSVLGGAGVAVSATSSSKASAAAFAAFASGREAQRRLVVPAGGQPGSRTAWSDPEVDAAAGGFYSGTRATIEAAWIRPRDRWWPGFQLEGGNLLNAALGTGASAAITFDQLTSLYHY
jgi:multiple sugar transport system substrate-binding protein